MLLTSLESLQIGTLQLKSKYQIAFTDFFETDAPSFSRIMTEIINVMFAAGEKYTTSVSGTIPLFYLKNKDDNEYHEIFET